MAKKLFKVISVFLLSLTLLFANFSLAKPVLAQTFTPEVSYILSDFSPGANSDITLVINQGTGGEPGLKRISISIPVGFEFTSSSQLGQNEKIGSGRFLAGLKPDGTASYNTDVSLFNDQSISGDQRAHWIIFFDDFSIPQIDVFVTGDSANRQNAIIEFDPSVLPLPTPIFWNLTILGRSQESGNVVVRNPLSPTVYTWRTDFVSNTNETATYLFGNGVLSPGSNVPITFDTSLESISINFSQIATQNSIAMIGTSYVPPQGGGQFRTGDGLYYDLNTSFDTTQACPCNVALSYNPLTNPNPKIYHLEDGVWVDVTTGVDTVNNKVSGIVSSLSFFAPGTPEFGLNFLDPVDALLKVSNPMQLDRGRTLPVNFTLTDSSGNFVSRDDVKVQVINSSNVQVAGGLISATALQKHYKANLDLKSLSLPDGTYRIRVIVGVGQVGSTTYTPVLSFNPV